MGEYQANEQQLAKVAYDAYCESTGGVSLISGDKLPPFENLRDEIKAAWAASAVAVRKYITACFA